MCWQDKQSLQNKQIKHLGDKTEGNNERDVRMDGSKSVFQHTGYL